MTILPRPGSTLWWLLFFNSRNGVTSMNHQIRLLQYSLQLCFIYNTLTLCSNALTLRTQESFHGKNRQITWPDTCPVERWAMGTDVLFYNGIIGNFIVYQDRIETFFEVMRPAREFGMVFCIFCYYFWGQHCCWTETRITGNNFFCFFLSSHCA